MREIEINANDANQRLDKFLLKYLNNLPQSLMHKYIRNKKIKVNGKRCQANQRLNAGDVIRCYIAEEFFEIQNDDTFLKVKGKLNVVYEDDNIIVMDKPSGLLSQSDANEKVENLVNKLKKYLYDKKEYDYLNEQSFAPAIVNRLDKNTSGLVIGAKNADSLRELNRMIKEDEISKQYITICCNKINKEGIFIDYHLKENGEILISSEPKKGYKEIKTGYKVIESNNKYSLLSVDLYTGKMHQIRAQLAYHGFPLLGDIRYGGKKYGKDYQILRAYKLSFNVSDDSILNYLDGKVIKCDYKEILDIYQKVSN